LLRFVRAIRSDCSTFTRGSDLPWRIKKGYANVISVIERRKVVRAGVIVLPGEEHGLLCIKFTLDCLRRLQGGAASELALCSRK